MEPVFLTLNDILEIHTDQIERYGGLVGVRDWALLESALAMPSAGSEAQYYHEDLFQMAAAYLFHIVQNHPFIDGNKRVGAAAATIFLFMNDIDLNANENAFEDLVRQVAQGRSNKAEVAAFFRINS